MKFKLTVKSINHAALLIALLVTIVVIISGSIVVAAYHFFLWGLAVICISTFVITYLFTRLVIKRGNLIETATAEIAGEVVRLEEVEHYRRSDLCKYDSGNRINRSPLSADTLLTVHIVIRGQHFIR